MFIMHLALQGCLRARNVDYGITPDTGGHIRYLLELVQAVESQPGAIRQEIVVRRFEDADLGPDYAERTSRVSSRCRIVRLDGAQPGYLSKEDLAAELPTLADRLEAHIRTLASFPDMIHAHYADAGALAAVIQERLGIPYLFTAHSLGRAKPAAASDTRHSRRIHHEEMALRGATRVVASSIDEAELQYRDYRHAAPEKIRVNPPGCDLAMFRAADPIERDGCRVMREGLIDPDKPVILAIARPVPRKNLATLIRAYAASPRLQRLANLVVFAGNQHPDDITCPVSCQVHAELRQLIDRHGLGGRAVLPGSHSSLEIPAIYRFAADRGGVFVNPALSEPFGLTLLEASAAGLPVVATCHGGPADIIGQAQNGLLVEPTSSNDIAAAIRQLLEDRPAWHDAARNGRRASERYSWSRHARTYLDDVAALCTRRSAVDDLCDRAYRRVTCEPAAPAFSDLLVCDIDGTLTGCPTSLDALRQWLDDHPQVCFAIATGRSLHSALDVMSEWGIPAPRVLITSVGAEIYDAPEASLHRLVADRTWPPSSVQGWPHERIAAALDALPFLRRQGPREQRAYKRCWFLDDPDRSRLVERTLQQQGLQAEVIASHGRFLDVLPKGVSKGHAIAHLADRLGVPMSRVRAAGDSGNDLHMLNMVGRPIVVGNCSDGLVARVTQPHAYFARGYYAAGVLEGLTRGVAEKSRGAARA